MSKEIIGKEIDQLMETIAEQWEIIRAYEGKIPLIEMDILRNNIRQLYDDLNLLEKLNKAPGIVPEKFKSKLAENPPWAAEPAKPAGPVVEEIPAGVPEKVLEETREQPDVIIEPEATTDLPEPETLEVESPTESASSASNEDFSKGISEPETIQTVEEIHINEPEPEDPPVQPEQPSANSAAPENAEETKTETKEPAPAKKPSPGTIPDLFGSSTTIADKYQADKKSIKDQHAGKEDDNSLGGKMQNSQITELKTAIGINDKFLFINELFKGDMAAYNLALETLNSFQSRQEALDKFDEMRLQYNWSEQATPFLRLYEIIKRRYLI